MEKTLTFSVYATLIVAPLAAGTVHTEVVFVLATALTVLLFIQEFLVDGPEGEMTFTSLPALAFWVFGGMCLLQLIPLPAEVHQSLGHRGWSILDSGWRALFGAGVGDSAWRPLSLDPAATADRGLRWWTLAVTAVVVGNTARRSRSRQIWREMLWTVTIASILVFLVGAVQVWFDAERILFVYEPRAEIGPFTTFVNPNHAAMLSGLGALAGFSIALRSVNRRVVETVLAAVAAFVSTLTLIEHSSVGATIAFCLSLGMLIIWFAGTTRAEKWGVDSEISRRLGYGVAGASVALPAGAAVSLYLGPARLRRWFWTTDIGQWIDAASSNRLDLLAAGLRAAGDYPLVGAGAGATERMLPVYIDWSRVPVASIPTIENEPVQWLYEFGWFTAVVGSLLLVGYLAASVVELKQTRWSRYATAGAVSLFMGFNAQFHFPFFTLGLALPFVGIVEAAFRSRRQPGEGSSVWRRALHVELEPRVRRGAVLSTAAGVLVCAGAWSEYEDGLSTVDRGKVASQSDLRRLAGWIPADGDLYKAGARASARAGASDERLRRLRFAVRVEPTASSLVALAHGLHEEGRQAEAVEAYRRVFSREFEAVPSRWVRAYLVRDLPNPDQLASALRDSSGEVWRRAYDVLTGEIGRSRAISFALALVDDHPEASVPYRLLLDGYVTGERYDLAEMWAQLVLDRARSGGPRERLAYEWLSRVFRLQGLRRRGHAFAREGFEKFSESLDIAMELVRTRPPNPSETTEADAAEIRRAVELICDRLGSLKWPDVPRHFCWLGRGWLDERAGDDRGASYSYRRVARRYVHPGPYARFLVRVGDCVELNRFIERWKRDQREERREKIDKLEDISDGCSR